MKRLNKTHAKNHGTAFIMDKVVQNGTLETILAA